MRTALATPHQVARLLRSGDSASCSEPGTIQGRHGVGKLERVLQACSLEHRITERSVKDVSGAGGVDTVHRETGRVNETSVFTGQRAIAPESYRGDAHFVFVLDALERAERIALAGPARGKFGAADQVIHAAEDLIEAGVNIIDIHAHRNSVLAGDAGSAGNGRRVVSVDVEHPRAGDLLGSNVRRIQRQAIRPIPKDGALASGFVDDDVGALIRAAGADLDII